MKINRSVTLAALTAALGLLFFLVFHNLNSHTFFFAEDQALSFAVAKSILAGDKVLIGPPSHLGGRHLGAEYYYFLALLLWLARGSEATALYLSSLSGFIAVGLTCLLALRLCEPERKNLAVLAVLLACCAGASVYVLRIHWHSHFLFIPSAVFLVCFHTALRRGAAFLGPYLLAGSILIQTHYGGGPLVAGCTLSLLASFIWGSDEAVNKRLSGSAAISLCWVLLALIWLPTLYYEITYGPNILRLLSRDNEPGATAGLYASVRCAVLFFARRGWQGTIFTFSRHFSYITSGCLLATIFLLILTNARRHRQVILFWTAILLSLVLYSVALAFQPAPLNVYYLDSMLPLPPLLLACGTVSAMEMYVRRPRTVAAFGAVLLFVFMRGVWMNLMLTEQILSPVHTLAHVRNVAALIRSDPSGKGSVEVMGRTDAALSQDSYHYFLGEYGRIKYSDTLRECRTFEATTKPEAAFLVACPFPTNRYKERLFADLRNRFSNLKGVSPGCYGCRNCLMAKSYP